jgi:hypothetical protein
MKMKNKKQGQVENKQRHKERLKKRGLEPDLIRSNPTRLERPTILIVCEGKNTEKSYFNQFRLTSARLVTLGDGYNTTSLVNKAIQINQAGKYEQVWCVFDKDDFAAIDFNNAITIAEANGFSVAYSNQAFEYWILLHFEDHQGGGMNRDEYNEAINEYLQPFGVTYDGNGSKIVTQEIFELMEALDPQSQRIRRESAIQRAQRNYNQFNHASPATEESSTTVFLLVNEILKYI